MKNRHSGRLYAASATIMLTILLLSLTGALLLTPTPVLGIESVTGAIWTSDPHGERVNGNLYNNAKNVYLAGGPHKPGAAGLPDGIYYFQVTDPAGKTQLSTDPLSKRKFEVKNGYIYSIDGGTHDWNPDTTRGYGIVVQLWPFAFTPNKGGEYKVWVTRNQSYTPNQGCFGFISSLSKTDNFKVKMNEAPKYFEFWVTDSISGSPYVAFYVSYALDLDGNPNTIDPGPWTTLQLIYDHREGAYDVFRKETTFALGSYIYWQFSISNTFTWASDTHGPELINTGGMVNKETLFSINGHKYNYVDNSGLPGWTITLFKDNVKIGETQTDSNGYYEFIALGPGNYIVSETVKFDEGWAPYGPTSYEFTADSSGDRTFDFYNYQMMTVTDTSDYRRELSSFDLVFTPLNDGSGMYKLSSTNPGSFYTSVVKYGEAGTPVRIELSLPPDKYHADYDSPNFILHHTYIGNTPLVDVHVYEGRQASPYGGYWVPDWSKDVTSMFSFTATEDGKHLTGTGNMPSTGLLFVTVHIDYQISGPLTWDEVQSFSGIQYTFGLEVYFSIIGIHRTIKVGSVK